MNLKSRVKMFDSVILNQRFSRALGGRSMGARAAVMAVTEETTHLVLVSYPLQSGKEVRDQILLDLSEHVKVIFVSGDRDNMCDLEKLEAVRGKMRCRTWRIGVQDADHGMNVKPKTGTESVGKKIGEVVASWTGDANEEKREGRIWWNGEEAVWSEWATEMPDFEGSERRVKNLEDEKKEMVPQANQRSNDRGGDAETKGLASTEEAVSSRTRKRRKL